MNRKQKQNKKSGEQTLPTRAFIPLLPMLLAWSKCQQATNICPALDNLKFRPCGGNYVLLVLRFVFFFFWFLPGRINNTWQWKCAGAGEKLSTACSALQFFMSAGYKLYQKNRQTPTWSKRKRFRCEVCKFSVRQLVFVSRQ